MTRDEVYREVEEHMGSVPTILKFVPDAYLEVEWTSWKTMIGKEGVIPPKWRELIMLGIVAAVGDDLSIVHCTETAKALGATDEEIKEVAYFAKITLGWEPFLKLNQMSLEQFREETQRYLEHMKVHEKVPVGGREKTSM